MTPEVRETLSEHHVDQLLQLFAGEWWTTRRRADDVNHMLAATDVIIAVVDAEDDRLVGFARALTDATYLAMILDVIVANDHRGAGIGRLLVEAVLTHPKIVNVNSVELVCQPEHMPFYERWGFTSDIGASRLMRRSADSALVASR